MRLLHVSKLEFDEFKKHPPPPYAILSHTWNLDHDEASFKDLQTLRHSTDHWFRVKLLCNQRFAKVVAFAQYVREHYPDVHYIWIDSCCINKDDKYELDTAINQMFKWYQKARVCVAYLNDVDDMGTFEGCRWFERGWTLQELLAAKQIVFVSKTWQTLGYKWQNGGDLDLLERIATRTGIPRIYLTDFENNRAGITMGQTMEWMQGRSTELAEDVVYSLFGILGIIMPIIYGEGVEQAGERLLDALKSRRDRLKEDYDNFRHIIAWLECPDPSENHLIARDQCQPGTGQWMLKSGVYQDWLDGRVKHIWLHGKPGCGKTILCSSVIDHVQERFKDAAYFYISLNEPHKQTYEHLLKGLISQWGMKKEAMALLQQAWDRPLRKALTTPQLERIVVAAAPEKSILILDALDESADDLARLTLLAHLERLLAKIKMQLFTTSRHLLEIKDVMDGIEAHEISMDPGRVQEDIHAYVKDQLAKSLGLRKFTLEIKTTIEQKIYADADGMFRWVALLMDELKSLQVSSKPIIEDTLKQFPKTLNDVYTRGLDAITSDIARKDALVLLQWLTYAQEPLSIDQLLDALVISPLQNTVNIDGRGTPENIFRLLSSFVDIVPGSGDIGPDTKITLAHASVREYLESEHAGFFRIGPKHGHHLLEQSCITYILWCKEEQRPLLPYALKSWYFHSQEMQPINRTELVGNNDPVAKQLETADLKGKWGDLCGNPLQAAASRGNLELVKLLVSLKADINASGGHYGRALQAASDEGNLDVVKFLLDKGAEINANGGYYGRAIAAAAAKGYVEVVKLLLKEGAAIDGHSGNLGSALQCAIYRGCLESVRLLINRGANVNIRAGNTGTPLQMAAAQGSIAIVKELIESGALVNAKGGSDDDTALHAAAAGNHVEIARLLVKHADVEITNGLGRKPLWVAAWHGHSEMGDLLLKAGAEKESRCNYKNDSCTALYIAATNGRAAMVKLLADAGADINAVNENLFTPINSAAFHGRIDVVKLLLERGADTELENDFPWSPLRSANERGHKEVVRLLVDVGARRDSRSSMDEASRSPPLGSRGFPGYELDGRTLPVR